MILIFEHDRRFGWRWLPRRFRYPWRCTKWTWRIVWGWWALAHYPEEGLKEFHDHVASGMTEWRDEES